MDNYLLVLLILFLYIITIYLYLKNYVNNLEPIYEMLNKTFIIIMLIIFLLFHYNLTLFFILIPLILEKNHL